MPCLNTGIVSLFHFNFIFKSTQTDRGGQREADTQTDRGRFNLMQVFHLGRLKNLILPPNQYSDPSDQLSYDIDKHKSLPFHLISEKILT